MRLIIPPRSGRVALSMLAVLATGAAFALTFQRPLPVRAQTDPVVDQAASTQDDAALVPTVVPARSRDEASSFGKALVPTLVPVPETPVDANTAGSSSASVSVATMHQRSLIFDATPVDRLMSEGSPSSRVTPANYDKKPLPEALTIRGRSPGDPDRFDVKPVSLGAPEKQPWYFLQAYGGATYSSGAGDQRGGGGYGARIAIPLFHRLAWFSEGYINNYSHGSQFAGSLGLFKSSSARGSLGNRIGYSILFDQFTDTELDSPYMAQMRYAVEYGLTETNQVGLRFTDGVAGSDVSLGGGAGTVFLQPFNSIDTYWRHSGAWATAELGVGYVDELNTVLYRTAMSKPLSERLSANFQLAYEDIGLWTGFAGLSIDLSGGRRSGGCGCHAANNRSAASAADEDLVRGGIGLGDGSNESSASLLSAVAYIAIVSGDDETIDFLKSMGLLGDGPQQLQLGLNRVRKDFLLQSGGGGGGCPADRPFRFCGPIDPNDCSCCRDALGNDCVLAP